MEPIPWPGRLARAAAVAEVAARRAVVAYERVVRDVLVDVVQTAHEISTRFACALFAAVSRDGQDGVVFDLNGRTDTVETGLELLREFIPDHQVTASGGPLPVPPDLSDDPIRQHLGDFPGVSTRQGIELTQRAFSILKSSGKLVATAL